MKVSYNFGRSSIQDKPQRQFGKALEKTTRSFFKYHPEYDSLEVCYTVFKANAGGNAKLLIKTTPASPHDFGNNPRGVPVIPYITGTQGLTCLMEVAGKSDDIVRTLVECGPYKSRRNGALKYVNGRGGENAGSSEIVGSHDDISLWTEQDIPYSPEEGSIAEGTLEEDSSIAVFPFPEPEDATQPEAHTMPPARVSIPKPRLSPHEYLVRAGVTEEKINRLKETLATIVSRAVGNDNIPSLLQVPVTAITKAIMEHMGLTCNASGNYRGTVASFYSARFSLFALKLSEKDADSLDSDALYTDWLIDCDLVLDFIGGKDMLSSLTRKREAEVREIVRQEELRESAPLPTAEAVEKAVEAVGADGPSEFGSYGNILALAYQNFEARSAAEQHVALAMENMAAQEAIIAKLQAELHRANEDRAAALELVKETQSAAAQYILKPDVLEKLRIIKAKVLDIANKYDI